MDRRKFLKSTAIGGAAAASTALAAPAYAQGNRTLTIVTSWGRGLAGVHDAAERVANSITEMSDGSLTIDLKAAGELVGAFEVFDAVTAGQADMYHAADYYFIGQHPGYAFFTAVPFGMTAQELVNWYYHDGGHDLHSVGCIFQIYIQRPILSCRCCSSSAGYSTADTAQAQSQGQVRSSTASDRRRRSRCDSIAAVANAVTSSIALVSLHTSAALSCPPRI